MKNTAIAFALGAVTLLSAAQQVPVQDVSTAQQQQSLQQISQQLVKINAALESPRHTGRACIYEDKIYSEGAIRQVGKTSLICVEREWGVRDMSEPVELVWEPTTSSRLNQYRSATKLNP